VNFFETDDRFDQDTLGFTMPDFTMWNDEDVQVYAELIEECPQLSEVIHDGEKLEVLEALFKAKGLDNGVLTKNALLQEEGDTEMSSSDEIAEKSDSEISSYDENKEIAGVDG
jgi:hypothetical protein